MTIENWDLALNLIALIAAKASPTNSIVVWLTRW